MERIKIKGGERVYSLAYADDVVLLTEEEGCWCMRNMMERLEEYLDGKELVLNAEETKIMRFRRGRERWDRATWY